MSQSTVGLQSQQSNHHKHGNGNVGPGAEVYLRSMSHLRLCQHPHQMPTVRLRPVGDGPELNVAWISTRRDDKSCAQFCHFPARTVHSTPPQLKFVSAYSRKHPFEVGMSDRSVGGTSTEKRFLHHVSARSNALHNLDVLCGFFF